MRYFQHFISVLRAGKPLLYIPLLRGPPARNKVISYITDKRTPYIP